MKCTESVFWNVQVISHSCHCHVRGVEWPQNVAAGFGDMSSSIVASPHTVRASFALLALSALISAAHGSETLGSRTCSFADCLGTIAHVFVHLSFAPISTGIPLFCSIKQNCDYVLAKYCLRCIPGAFVRGPQVAAGVLLLLDVHAPLCKHVSERLVPVCSEKEAKRRAAEAEQSAKAEKAGDANVRSPVNGSIML
jgi:hypothetical protein